MDERKVYSVDVEEWDLSTLTQHMKVKCDCEKEDEYIRYCDWMAADALDVKLDKACVYSANNDTSCDEDGCYYCYRTPGPECSSSTEAYWKEAGLGDYCSRNNDEVNPLDESNQAQLYKCEYMGKIYVSTYTYGDWQDVNAYCTSQGADCGPNMTSSGMHVCMFMKGFEGETPYKCNGEYTWEKVTKVAEYCNGVNYWLTNEGQCNNPFVVNKTCDYTNGTTYACCITAEATETDPAEYGWVEGDKCPATETPVDDTDNNG